MLREILSYKESDKYKEIVLDLSSLEEILTGKSSKRNLTQFLQLLKDEQYDRVMDQIESNKNIRLSFAIIYDKLLKDKMK